MVGIDRQVGLKHQNSEHKALVWISHGGRYRQVSDLDRCFRRQAAASEAPEIPLKWVTFWHCTCPLPRLVFQQRHTRQGQLERYREILQGGIDQPLRRAHLQARARADGRPLSAPWVLRPTRRDPGAVAVAARVVDAVVAQPQRPARL